MKKIRNDKFLKLIHKVDKAVEQYQFQDNQEKNMIYSLMLQSYSSNLKGIYSKQKNYTEEDFDAIKDVIENISYQEESFSGSLNYLMLFQQLKVLSREKYTEIGIALGKSFNEFSSP